LFKAASLTDGVVNTVASKTGITTTTGKDNNVKAQDLTVVGNQGSEEVVIAAGDTAAVIAGKVNAVSSDTGVTASASTVATIGNLSSDGSVTFTLQG
jgi:flagellin